jgi:hypothetical protein
MFDDNQTVREVRLGQVNMAALNFGSRVLRFVVNNPAAEFKFATCKFRRKDTLTTDRVGVVVSGRFQVPGRPHNNPEIRIIFSLICLEGEWHLNGNDAQIMFGSAVICARYSSDKGFEPGNKHSESMCEGIREVLKSLTEPS